MPNEETNVEEVELVLEPFPPDTIDSIKEEFEVVVREALLQASQEDLLDSKHIDIQREETFPVGELVVHISLWLTGAIAKKTFDTFVWPAIEERFRAYIKQRQDRGRKP